MARITKRLVDGLGGENVGRIIRDDDLAGFGGRRNADGSATHLVEYRAGRGRGFPTRRLSLGRHGALTPEQARNEAKQVLARVARGEDPAADRSVRKKDPTIRDVLLLALDQHWKPKRKPSTAKVFGEMVHRTLIPEFGAIRLAELTRSQVRAWHAKQGHRPRAANHELAVLRKALSLAICEGLLTGENPAKGIALHPENARDRVTTDDELRAVWRAIDEAPIRSHAKLLFKLLALTGRRREEWLSARWQDVDLSRAVYTLRESRTSGSTCARTGSRTACSTPTRRSSMPPAMPGGN